jgi:hypothetical protein
MVTGYEEVEVHEHEEELSEKKEAESPAKRDGATGAHKQ